MCEDQARPQEIIRPENLFKNPVKKEMNFVKRIIRTIP